MNYSSCVTVVLSAHNGLIMRQSNQRAHTHGNMKFCLCKNLNSEEGVFDNVR